MRADGRWKPAKLRYFQAVAIVIFVTSEVAAEATAAALCPSTPVFQRLLQRLINCHNR